MNTIKELNRKTWYCEDDGVACGPAATTSIDAVLIVDDQGETVYLHAQWVDAAGPEIYYDASKENLMDICQKISEAEDMEELTRFVDDLNQAVKLPNDYVTNRYSDQLEELEQMIIAEAKEHGVYYLLHEEDDEDEEE